MSLSSYFMGGSEPEPPRTDQTRYDYGAAHRRSGGGYSHHSDTGYGAQSSGYGGHSGHGGYKDPDCCPLVVDPLTLAALFGAIAAGTVFLNTVITMNITGRRRRKRGTEDQVLDVVQKGRSG